MLCYVGLGPEIGKAVYKPCFMYKLINFNQSENFISFLSHFLSVLAKFSFLLLYTIRNITSAEEEGVDANIRAFVVEAVVLGSFRG